MVIQEQNRKHLRMDILMFETCGVHKKWNKIASNIKVVFYSSTNTEESYVYWIVHHLESWIKRDQLDVTCFIISLFNVQHVLDINTSETCWALNNEIIKQVTSSWSLFIQLIQKSMNVLGHWHYVVECISFGSENDDVSHTNTEKVQFLKYCTVCHIVPLIPGILNP